MYQQANTSIPTLRELTGMIRAGLDAAGRQDVAVDPIWFDDSIRGEPLLLNVPIGPDLVVPLRPRDNYWHCTTATEVAQHVEMFVKALMNLKQGEQYLGDYARGMRDAGFQAITKARAQGFELMLDGVSFKPTTAFFLWTDDWKYAVDHVIAEVHVRCISAHLRLEVTELCVEEEADLVDAIDAMKDEQRERQRLIAGLAALSADARIDSVTLDLLRSSGADVTLALRQACAGETVKIALPGDGDIFVLVSWDGRVHPGAHIGALRWDGKQLILPDDEMGDLEEGASHTLGDRASHPAFANVPIVGVTTHSAGMKLLSLATSDFLFDAQSGRLWPEEERVA